MPDGDELEHKEESMNGGGAAGGDVSGAKFLSFAWNFAAVHRVVFLRKVRLPGGKVGKEGGFFGLRN